MVDNVTLNDSDESKFNVGSSCFEYMYCVSFHLLFLRVSKNKYVSKTVVTQFRLGNVQSTRDCTSWGKLGRQSVDDQSPVSPKLAEGC